MERLTTDNKIALMKQIGIEVVQDRLNGGFTPIGRGVDLWHVLQKAGYRRVLSHSYDPTCSAHTDGTYRLTIIAATPTYIDFGLESEYDDEY